MKPHRTEEELKQLAKDIIALNTPDICPFCNEAHLEPVKGVEPFSEDHMICPRCDSTYNIKEPRPFSELF